MRLEEIQALVRDVPDFPQPGILFKDITPLLSNVAAFGAIIDQLAALAKRYQLDGILAIESRGFIFGAALAHHLQRPFYPVRKRGKLPRATVGVEYALEYGSDHIEVHADVIERGGHYLIVDDVIATGGTAAATARLVAQQGGTVAACLFVLELGFLNGRHLLGDVAVESLIRY